MNTLERPRLLHLLDAALETSHVLITAPAGYGKSTLLRQLARRRPNTYLFSLTAADVDLTVLRERLEPALSARVTLLLDDVHQVAESTDVSSWLLQQLQQSHLRIVFGTRTRPDWLPLPLLANGHVRRLTADDLRFSSAESGVLLSAGANHSHDLTGWLRRLEGWPLGLALLAQLAQTTTPLPEAEQQIFGYLATAVFSKLPSDLQTFLQRTAVPLQFSDDLATHLMGDRDRAIALHQEALRRNLFLEEADEPGWFRYHDLIRNFLIGWNEFDAEPWFHCCVSYFQKQNDPINAIEHALAGGLQHEAAQAILALSFDHIYEHERYRTYQRWVAQLDPQVRDQYPGLSLWLGHFLHFLPDEEGRARQYVQHALALAQTSGNHDVAVTAQLQLVSFDLHDQGATPEVVRKLEALSQEPDLSGKLQVRIQRLLAQALSDLARFRRARTAWEKAVALAQQAEIEQEIWSNRRGLALYVLVPLGDFARAQSIYSDVLVHFADSPGWTYEILQNVCDLYVAQGDWTKLAETLARIDELLPLLETDAVFNQIWIHYARALLAIAQEAYARAEHHLAQMAPLIEDYPIGQMSQCTARIWLARRQGRDASALAQEYLAQPSDLLLYQVLLALEVDIARALVGEADLPFVLHADTQKLIQWRCRAELVRLRALLAAICWRAGNVRWRRHVRAALYALKTYPNYEHLLTRRDPDLGAHFWPLVLLAGFADERAKAALRQIGQPQPLYPLLRHTDAAVRALTAEGLAAVGREEALSELGKASSNEKNKAVQAALNAAIAALEEQPPPPLRIQMLGGFRLWRGDEEISPDAWSRPIVQRLFQYFILHRGETLARDRILDDLWPGSDPDKAWSTLRTVYSRLRAVLEPFAQSKGLNRYVVLDGGSYAVDPQDVMQIDVEHFERTVCKTLRDARSGDVPPLPPKFLTTLEEYTPLLPEIPYEDWLLEPRQRLTDLHINGCLYAAEALLIRGEPARAQVWARRALNNAPWLEEAYAALIRALARQGQRSAALRVYETAVTALRRELDAPPSPQTQWIAERLRRGEEV